MTELRLSRLSYTASAQASQVSAILDQQSRNTTKYIAEGVTFLVLILIGAFFVHRAMRKQLRYVALQRNFMMAITHELKTPIAATRLSVETLLYRELKTEQQKKLLQSALAETDRLNTLTSNILLASQLEEKTFRAAHDTIRVSEILLKISGDYVRRFPERTMNIQIEEGLTMQGDVVLVEMVFSNLIENALKYSPRDKAVGVKLKKEAGHILIMISDEGTGIPDSEKEKIFEKFYRMGNEDTRRAKGTGLGLYLARKIAAAHHGTIKVKDNSPSGSIFTVQF
jgi:K+-sensing histidine kinase KdpD